MKAVTACVICFLACYVTSLRAQIDYSTVVDPNVIVTGVRSDSETQGTDSVVITASYNLSGGNTVAAIYQGSLAGATSPGAVWNQLTPVIAGETITSSSFYGPNTSIFTPSLGSNIIAVGSYKYTQSTSGTAADHGLLYEGTAQGVGTWTQIDATPLATGTETVEDTIAHSTMGNLVVGNYDTGGAGKAFIYNIATNTWTNANPNNAVSVTAYGIWQTGGSSSSSFIITGGYSNLNGQGLDQGYIEDYDSADGEFSNFKTYNFDDQPLSALTSHFDGITATADGYNLTGYYILADGFEGGFMASITINPDGSFSDAAWTNIVLTGSITTGNTVIDNSVLGFSPTGTSSSFIAAVPEPAPWGMLSTGAGILLLGACFRRVTPVS